MPNLIVILFNIVYPVFYVRFHCMSCVWEGVWRLKSTLKIKGVFAGSSQEDFLQSEAMCSAYDWNVKNHDRWWQLVFVSISRVRPSHKILAKHSVLLFCHIWYTMSLPTLYIPTSPYPNSWEVDSPNTYHTHPECKVRFWCC